MIKTVVKKLLPKSFLLEYHKILALLAAWFYGWPSRKMVIIGVTGTGGKSTVVNLIGRILEEAGYKVGWTTTMNFKMAEKEWLNKTKMTMLGRFALQKFLCQMVRAGCQYAVIETSSEGIVQSRHLGINYDVAVFTNLSPEHIESHGSFEKYRSAKSKLFAKLKNKNEKLKIIDGKIIKKISVINLDDKDADYFLQFEADEKYGYQVKNKELRIKNQGDLKIIKAANVRVEQNGSRFIIHNSEFIIHLLGEFNVANSLAAITVAVSQGVSLETCQKALEKIKSMPGRMEVVVNQPLTVIIDYAHTPDSLEQVYKTIRNSKFEARNSKLICVLGAAGGGRDKWKRPKLGELAAKYCDEVIVTSEDPYDESPQKIIDQVAAGTHDAKLYKILDRGEAIKRALELARPSDIIIITGKGCEPYIMGPEGQKIPWDDRQTVKELLKL